MAVFQADAEVFCFTGLWDVAHTADGRVEGFTIITTAPGPDCAPYHNRQPVIFKLDQWATWLDLSSDPAGSSEGRPGGWDHCRAGQSRPERPEVWP